jgi:hypothetical protein
LKFSDAEFMAPAVQELLDVLNRAAIRRKLEVPAGYDTSHTGEVLMAG